MRAQDNLPSGSSLDTSEHLRNEPDNLRMKREFRFLKEQRPTSVENCPKKAHQAEGSVRKLVFALPCSLWAPMLIFAAQVRGSSHVTPQFETSNLRNCDTKSVQDAAEPGMLGFFRRPCYLLEEISAERIVLPSHGTVRLANQLRYYMKIPDGSKEIRHLPEFLIDIHLL